MHVQKQGFTLIEVMIVTIILGIIMIPLARYIKLHTISSIDSRKRLEFRSDSELFLRKLTWELRQTKREDVEIFNIAGDADAKGLKLNFQYTVSLSSDLVVMQYTYDPASHLITLSQQIGTAPVFTKTVITGIQEIDITNNPNVIFEKLNSPDDEFIETFSVKFVPHEKRGIRQGDATEKVVTSITTKF